MPVFGVNGIDVDFPKDPYPCQLDYMRSTIRAISASTNALLESPTGTGKTLSLLCATLAWQKHMRAMSARVTHKLEYNSGPTTIASSSSSSVQAVITDKANQKKKTTSTPCTIVYASRTHSQLAQVVDELKSTNYRPRMTVLGSRDQLCIHVKISKLKSGALNNACNSLNSQRGCSFKNNLEKYSPATEGNAMSVMDIEEVKRVVGHTDRVCPYFYTRELSANADLVLLPYNYLLDSSIRNTLKLDWQNSVIIFDEAHNLERVASDAASFTLTSTDLAGCIMELQSVLKSLQETKESMGDAKEETTSKGSDPLFGGGGGGGGGGKEPPTIQGTVRILRALFELEKKIDSVPLSNNGPGDTPSNVLPGAWLCTLLEEIGLLHTMASANVEEIRRCSSYLLEEAESNAAGGLSVPEPKLVALSGALNRVFRGRTLQESCAAVVDYKVFICEEETPKKGQGSGYGSNGYKSANGVWINGGNTPSVKKKRVLNFWAFSPGIAMEDLKKLGVRSIILTSGTLSPMASFKKDMKLPFPIELENKHVIENKQIWVGCLTTGCTGKQLNSSYKVRETAEYKDELGGSILNIIRTMAGQGGMGTIGTGMPPGPELKGGILVFFPSYGVMNNCVDRWKETGMLDKLGNVGGSVVVEPKGSNAGPASARAKPQGVKKGDRWSDSSGGEVTGPKGFGFTSSAAPKAAAVDEDDDGSGAVLGGVIKEFEATLSSRGRCVLLAVCRGKASEGIDFRNNKGRVVIITGIPFAPPKDPWVVLKREYLDERALQQLPPKNQGSGSARVSMGLEESKKVFGSTGGFGVSDSMPPPYKPYVPSSYYSYDKANGHNVPGNDAVTRPVTAYPPYQPQPQPQSSSYTGNSSSGSYSGSGSNSNSSSGYPTSYNTYNQSSGSSASGGVLDGQGWYNQTASRAVNQAIGRVIRHKKDWGAIFLLDDRFQNDKQVQQLSSWVRPRLSKYQKFPQALVEFRRFLTSAMADPDLKIPVPVPAAVDSRPPGYVQAMAAIAASTAAAAAAALEGSGNNFIMRKISIRESDLDRNGDVAGGRGDGDGDSAGVSFIDPELLMTQQTEYSTRTTSSVSTSARIPAPVRAQAPVILPFSASQGKSFGLNKSSGNSNSNSSDSVSTFNSSSDSNNNSSNSNSNSSSTRAPSASTSLSDFLLKMGGKTSTSSSTSSTTRVSASSSQNQNQNQNHSQSTLPNNRSLSDVKVEHKMVHGLGSNIAAPSSQKSVVPATTVKNQRTDVRTDVKTERHPSSQSNSDNTVKQKNQSSSDREKEMENNKRRMLMTSFSQGISTVGEKRIEKKPAAQEVTVRAALTSKSSSTVSSSSSSNVSNVSKSTASSNMSSSNSNCSQGVPASKAIDQKSLFGYNYTDTLSQVDQAGADQPSQPSKRARMMLQAALQAPQPVVKRDLKNVIASINASKARNQLGGSEKENCKDRQAAMAAGKISKKYVCTVCKNDAAEPCAAKCGHICCESCWSQWLRRSETCPCCRAPTMLQQIKKITIVKC